MFDLVIIWTYYKLYNRVLKAVSWKNGTSYNIAVQQCHPPCPLAIEDVTLFLTRFSLQWWITKPQSISYSKCTFQAGHYIVGSSSQTIGIEVFQINSKYVPSVSPKAIGKCIKFYIDLKVVHTWRSQQMYILIVNLWIEIISVYQMHGGIFIYKDILISLAAYSPDTILFSRN